MQVIYLNLSSADPFALRQKSGARMLDIEVYSFLQNSTPALCAISY
jgi:hypothetical protein